MFDAKEDFDCTYAVYYVLVAMLSRDASVWVAGSYMYAVHYALVGMPVVESSFWAWSVTPMRCAICSLRRQLSNTAYAALTTRSGSSSLSTRIAFFSLGS